jgi:penicillin-insensitive murein DD-endopeptidase
MHDGWLRGVEAQFRPNLMEIAFCYRRPVLFHKTVRFLCHISIAAVFQLMSAGMPAHAESTCYGRSSAGRIEGAVQLPESGANYSAYSSLGVAVGRTYVHDRVRDVVAAAYSALVTAAPEKVFMYGETGWKSGGRLRPHRTHENGLSVDFFVPVTDSSGKSVPFPAGVFNKFGYGIDFDAEGKYGSLTIDFEAMGEHLYQLGLAARKANVSLARVIFDPPYLPRLFATRHGEFLRHNVNFMKGRGVGSPR